MSELLYDAQGGVQDLSGAALSRAKRVDLVVLPTNVVGTNCGNCEYVKPLETFAGITEGFCSHKEVQQQVTSVMCCAKWDAAGTKRMWKGR